MAKKTSLSSTVNLGGKKKLLTKKKIDVSKVDEIATKIQKQTSSEEKKTVRITIDMPNALHKAMKMKVFAEGKTVKDHVLGLIKENLKS